MQNQLLSKYSFFFFFCKQQKKNDPLSVTTLDSNSIKREPILYQVCGRTNKQRDINFLQRLQHSVVTFIAWEWEERCYQTIGLYYSGYNRAGWRVLYVSVSLSAIASLHSPPVWLLQRQVVCDRLLCPLSKTLHLSRDAASSLFSLLQPLLIFRDPLPPPPSTLPTHSPLSPCLNKELYLSKPGQDSISRRLSGLRSTIFENSGL